MMGYDEREGARNNGNFRRVFVLILQINEGLEESIVWKGVELNLFSSFWISDFFQSLLSSLRRSGQRLLSEK